MWVKVPFLKAMEQAACVGALIFIVVAVALGYAFGWIN